MLNKPDIILALGILFDLDAKHTKNLGKLDKDTLERIYDSYKQNAIRAQNAIEQALAHGRSNEQTSNGGDIRRQVPKNPSKSSSS